MLGVLERILIHRANVAARPIRDWAPIGMKVGSLALTYRNKAQHYTRVVNELEGFGEVPDTRLAVYGTLAPGRVNHHQVSALVGNWLRGTVRGQLFSSGWGAAVGFPGLILDPLGPSVDVDLFESAELPQHWNRLDEFEGSGYKRVVATVNTERGERRAWIYVLAEEPR